MRFPVILMILLLLTGCNDDSPTQSSKAAEAARIEKEVARRVEAARYESIVRNSRLRTIRVVGFIVLAGGAVTGLIWLKNRRFPEHPALHSRHPGMQSPPLWNDHYPSGNGRVIDFPPGPANPRPGQTPHPPTPPNPP